MNIHPILVHFPIAFFTIYALMELLRFNFLTRRSDWMYVKAALVIVGTGGAALSILTGNMASALIRNDVSLRHVRQLHEFYAKSASLTFGILAAGYVILILEREGFSKLFANSQSLLNLWKLVVKLADIISNSWLTVIWALVGLCLITITGGLGGAMVYGPTADPFFAPIYHYLTGM